MNKSYTAHNEVIPQCIIKQKICLMFRAFAKEK